MKRKLNLNVYFLWVPVSRLAGPCFPTHPCGAQWYPQRNSSWLPPVAGSTAQTSDLELSTQKTWNKNSAAMRVHFSLRLWKSIEKEQSSRGKNGIQFSRATSKRLRHKTIVIFLQLPASFTTHLLILTNKQRGRPIGKSLLYSTLLIHPPWMLHLCALNEAGMLCEKQV